MLDKYYKILGVSSDATDEEIKNSYEELKSKYLEDRFLEGEEGNLAAKKLTEVETAYAEITASRNQSYQNPNDDSLFAKIDTAIRSGYIRSAQEMLDSFDERGAEWHYYQSVVFYKKNWFNESKKQLEIALQIDGTNEKYKTALQKLNDKVNNANRVNPGWNQSGTGGGTQYTASPNGPEQQLGGDSCMQWCCDMLICNMMLNCCCGCR